jgi:4-methyl-5(b-hydroxyethyl)-thiazole monophosphate biosynthesis
MDAVRFAWENSKFVAAICAGPTVLADLGITDGKNTTCYPGCETAMGSSMVDSSAACIRDGNVITAASAGCAVAFALTLIEALKDKQTSDAIRQQIVIR